MPDTISQEPTEAMVFINEMTNMPVKKKLCCHRQGATMRGWKTLYLVDRNEIHVVTDREESITITAMSKNVILKNILLAAHKNNKKKSEFTSRFGIQTTWLQPLNTQLNST